MTTTILERRATKPMGKNFWEAVRDILFGLDTYNPEHYNKGKYYMRGPGPKWHEKHGLPYPPDAAIEKSNRMRQY